MRSRLPNLGVRPLVGGLLALLAVSAVVVVGGQGAPVQRGDHLFIGATLTEQGPAGPRGEAQASAPRRPCRLKVRAVPFRYGGKRVDRSLVAPGPHPCLYRTGYGGWEPTIGITNQGIFYRAYARDEAEAPLSVIRSTDGGRTWQEVESPDQPGAFSDPYLASDRSTGRIFDANFRLGACSSVAFTDDGGQTWTASDACGLADHETVFTGSPVSSQPIDYPNVVYFCAIEGGLGDGPGGAGCLKSLDGGTMFVATGDLAYPHREDCDGAPGHGVVGPDGSIYLPKGWCGQPHIAFSRDEGQTWSRVKVANNGMAFDSAFGKASHEAAVAVDRKGNLYYVWVARNDLPYLSISRTRGRTWSKPRAIPVPGILAASVPGIDVGRAGRIAIVYMGETKPLSWGGYITISANALARKPLFYGIAVNPARDPLVRGSCGAIRCEGAGDFFDIVVGPDGTPWAALVDPCKGSCATGDVQPDRRGEAVVGRLVGGPPLR